MKMKAFIGIVVLLISACSSNPNKPPNNKQLLAMALHNKNFVAVETLLPQVRMVENTGNIIHLFLSLHSDNLLVIDRQVEYIKQFLPDMSAIHQQLFEQMMIWLYVKQIYRHEISPPVRILQREELFLAPSNIDFNKCPSDNSQCAVEVRKKLRPLMTDEDLLYQLKKMALKDPCVNSSKQLQGEAVANRCLRKSKGHLKIELLPLPRFSTQQWLEIISSEK
jgi:hypothetical protein